MQGCSGGCKVGHVLPLGSEVKPVKSISFAIQIASEATLMLVLLRNVLNYTNSSFFFFFPACSVPPGIPRYGSPPWENFCGHLACNFFNLHQATAGHISFFHVMTCHILVCTKMISMCPYAFFLSLCLA